MRVDLAYGKTGLTVELPDDRTTVIEPTFLPTLADPRGALIAALRNPIDRPPLRRLVKKDQTVAIAVCDITRPMPSSTVLPVVLGELAHVPRDQVTVLVATGTHRGNSTEELEEMLGRDVVRDYRIVNHDAFDRASLDDVGVTSAEVPVVLNRVWTESDVRIGTGFVEPHLFAGFSGGPKMVTPGLAGIDTVMVLHNAEMLGHPKAIWGVTEGNPVHDAIREAAGMAPPDFSVDVTINRDRGITTVYAGEVFAVHRAACQAAKRVAMRPVDRRFDVVVTTNSGYPLDLNLYQSVKGMSAAAQVVSDGGSIICAAECSDGLPDHGEFRQLLAMRETPQELLDMVNEPGFSRHDQWQVQLQAQIQVKARVLLKSGYLTDEQVRSAHLEPVDDVERAAVECLAGYGPDAEICVLPEGPQTIPYIA